MAQRLRLVILVLALAVAVPTLGPGSARAADVPASTDVGIPKPLRDWLKKNAIALYVILDELVDDLTGCDCPPPQAPPPPQEY